MIALAQPLAAGAAVRLILAPTAGALWTRVLRRTSDTFTGPDDPGAVVVADETDAHAVVDITGLVNGVTYFWRAYDRMPGNAWQASPSLSAVPRATFAGDEIDPQSLVRERVAVAMAEEVRRGALRPAAGVIPVVLAPFALADGISFPCVSVHLDSEGTAERAIGEVWGDDVALDPGPGWIETESAMVRTSLSIVGASLNPDERLALRRALQRAVLANLPIFEARGLTQVEFSQTDDEQPAQNGAPLFLTAGTFACTSIASVRGEAGEVVTVTSTASTEWD